MSYVLLKHLHVTFVVLSVTGFFLRGLLMMRESPLQHRRWIKIAPHVNDTALLAAALGLVVVTGQYPFVHDWVTAKIFGLIVYIILGAVALRAGRTRRVRIAALMAALVVFGWLVSVALTKNPWGFVSWPGGG